MICRRCGVKVMKTVNGWKHATGGKGTVSCGLKPEPVESCDPHKQPACDLLLTLGRPEAKKTTPR